MTGRRREGARGRRGLGRLSPHDAAIGRSLFAALLALAVLCGCERRPLRLGQIATDGATAGLTLRIVDGRRFAGDEPIAGARVAVEQGGVRVEGSTGGDGLVSFGDLDLLASRTDVTIVAAGFGALTVHDLGAQGLDLTPPIAIGLRTLDACGACVSGAEAYSGRVTRIGSDTTIFASVPGDATRSDGTSWFVRRAHDLTGSPSLVVLETTTGLDSRIAGFARRELPPAPLATIDVVMEAPDEVERVTARVERRFEVGSALGTARVQLRAVSEDARGVAENALGALDADDIDPVFEVALEHLPGASSLTASVVTDSVSTYTRVPLGSSVSLQPPPRLVADEPVALFGGAPLRVEGGEWAHARAVVVASDLGVHWTMLLASAESEVRFPALPSGVSLGEVIPSGPLIRVGAWAATLDEPPSSLAPSHWWPRVRHVAYDIHHLAHVE